jgi:putative ABC transport system ATP-binding protein
MAKPLVQATNVNLHLATVETSLHVLRDVNLTIERGEVVACIGPSGSGKTSLLMVLGGLERPSSGSVVIDGTDLSRLNEDQLADFRRKNLGVLFQNFHLMPALTALENVMLALEIAERDLSLDEIAKMAAVALDEVGLKDRAGHLPVSLSGGEQQRVALARSMVTKPKLLLADEPTGDLDHESGARIVDLMFDLARGQGTTLLLITHDSTLANAADRIVRINEGVLTEDRVAAAT